MSRQKLENKQTAMSKDIEHIKKDMAEVKDYIKEDRLWKVKKEKSDRDWREDFFEKIDDCYARKETAKKIWGAIGGIIIVGITIASGIIGYIGKYLV